jgi:hypothetical protein
MLPSSRHGSEGFGLWGFATPQQAAGSFILRRGTLHLLKQGTHIGDRVRVAFQTVLGLFGLHFNL